MTEKSFETKPRVKRIPVRGGPENKQYWSEVPALPTLVKVDKKKSKKTSVPKVPAQQPTGKWDPNIDTSDQDWTNH